MLQKREKQKHIFKKGEHKLTVGQNADGRIADATKRNVASFLERLEDVNLLIVKANAAKTPEESNALLQKALSQLKEVQASLQKKDTA